MFFQIGLEVLLDLFHLNVHFYEFIAPNRGALSLNLLLLRKDILHGFVPLSVHSFEFVVVLRPLVSNFAGGEDVVKV